jgi:hypothetical protein
LCNSFSGRLIEIKRKGGRETEMKNMVVVSDEKQDFINKLPNEFLTFILSKLQVDEAVRCNILSKRWVGLWKQAHHIEFNAKHMIKPMTQLLHSRESIILKVFLISLHL